MVVLSPYYAVGVLKLNCFLPDFEHCRELFEQLPLLALISSEGNNNSLVKEHLKSVTVSLNFDLISFVTSWIISNVCGCKHSLTPLVDLHFKETCNFLPIVSCCY